MKKKNAPSNILNPMKNVKDEIYGGRVGEGSNLPGNAQNSQQFLQRGTGGQQMANYLKQANQPSNAPFG